MPVSIAGVNRSSRPDNPLSQKSFSFSFSFSTLSGWIFPTGLIPLITQTSNRENENDEEKENEAGP